MITETDCFWGIEFYGRARPEAPELLWIEDAAKRSNFEQGNYAEEKLFTEQPVRKYGRTRPATPFESSSISSH